MKPSAPVLLNRLLARARLRHVQVLVAVSTLGSLQRAAQSLGLSQPAVTHIVSDLEQLLEEKLFQRHARGARPTAVALELLPAARRMLDALGQGAEAVAAQVRAGSGVVRLAASAAALTGLLNGVLPAFGEAHAEVQVHVTLAEADVLGSIVPRDDVDLVACRVPAAVPEGWRFTPLRDDSLVVVAAPPHRLARRRHVRIDEFAGETWLVSPVETLARQSLEALALERGWSLRRSAIVTRALPMTWAVLARGQTVAMLPRSVVLQLVQSGQLVILPVDRAWPIASLGLLDKLEGSREAATRLRDFIVAHHRT